MPRLSGFILGFEEYAGYQSGNDGSGDAACGCFQAACENPEEAVFSDLPCRFVHGRAVEDQWMMSQCDYLMGPPSTFSAWASFMGKVPIARMWSTEYRIKVDDFAYRGLEA